MKLGVCYYPEHWPRRRGHGGDVGADRSPGAGWSPTPAAMTGTGSTGRWTSSMERAMLAVDARPRLSRRVRPHRRHGAGMAVCLPSPSGRHEYGCTPRPCLFSLAGGRDRRHRRSTRRGAECSGRRNTATSPRSIRRWARSPRPIPATAWSWPGGASDEVAGFNLVSLQAGHPPPLARARQNSTISVAQACIRMALRPPPLPLRPCSMGAAEVMGAGAAAIGAAAIGGACAAPGAGAMAEATGATVGRGPRGRRGHAGRGRGGRLAARGQSQNAEGGAAHGEGKLQVHGLGASSGGRSGDEPPGTAFVPPRRGAASKRRPRTRVRRPRRKKRARTLALRDSRLPCTAGVPPASARQRRSHSPGKA